MIQINLELAFRQNVLIVKAFLFPAFKSSSLNGQSLQIPYFKVLADNKDMTISPRLFLDNNITVLN